MPSIPHWRSTLGSETTCSRLEELRTEYWGERESGLFGYRQQSPGVAGILLPQHQFNSFYVILKISTFIHVNTVFIVGKTRCFPNRLKRTFKDRAVGSQQSPAATCGSGLRLRLAGHVSLYQAFKDLFLCLTAKRNPLSVLLPQKPLP